MNYYQMRRCDFWKNRILNGSIRSSIDGRKVKWHWFKKREQKGPSKHSHSPGRAGSHQLWGNQSAFSMAGKNVGLARADPLFCASWADSMQGIYWKCGGPELTLFINLNLKLPQHGQSPCTLTMTIPHTMQAIQPTSSYFIILSPSFSATAGSAYSTYYRTMTSPKIT